MAEKEEKVCGFVIPLYRPCHPPKTAEDFDKELDFFVHISKPLIYSLQYPSERYMAAKWMKRLLAEENDDIVLLEKRNNFMKLLFLLAQYGYLAGPFSDLPPVRGLPPFPSFVEITDLEQLVMTKEKRLGGPKLSPMIDFGNSCNNDIVGFVQLAPEYCVQSYLRASKDPVEHWKNPPFAYWSATKGVQDETSVSSLNSSSDGLSSYMSGKVSPDSGIRMNHRLPTWSEIMELYTNENERIYRESSTSVEEEVTECLARPSAKRIGQQTMDQLPEKPFGVPTAESSASSTTPNSSTRVKHVLVDVDGFSRSLQELKEALYETQQIIKEVLKRSMVKSP